MKTLFCFLLCAAATAQTATPAGSTERIKVHAKSLEGNLTGDSPDRYVSIYLPPSYKTERGRRYPVLYFLHGFTDDDARWFGLQKHWISLPAILDKVFASGAAKEMIVVMPNAFTAFQGSMYSNSVTTGDWESFVARELVAYIDSHYRTIPHVASRGLAGHSMGGYGTMRIGMKNPGTFSSIYLLSPCCMMPNLSPRPAAATPPPAESVKTLEEVAKADFGTKAMLASAAAWSPNPKNPPLYLDLPTKNGEFQPTVAARWAANAPLAQVDQFVQNLKQLKAIAFDAGTRDRSIAAGITTLDSILTHYAIPHFFEIYEGDHVNRIGERIEIKALPFFSSNLSFAQPKR